MENSKEIEELLQNDLYYNENEENAKELETTTNELVEKQNELKQSEAYWEDVENNKNLIDVEYLTDYLEERGVLTFELKNIIEEFTKLHQTKSDLIEYANYITEYIY